jgi:hypothetical protein
MIRIRGPDQTRRIADPDIRNLVEKRLSEICDGEVYDAEIHGEMIIAEFGDTLESLEGETGYPIASNPFDESRYPDPDFEPICEYMEEHSQCYELTFLFSDDGAGACLFIPKSAGIDADVLAFCATFSSPLIPIADRADQLT